MYILKILLLEINNFGHYNYFLDIVDLRIILFETLIILKIGKFFIL
jgi:hypothetical protein